MRRPAVLIAIVGVLLLTVLWWLFIASPRRAEVDDLRTQRDAAVITEEQLRSEKAQLLEIQENELSYMTASAALENLIPPTPDLPTFIDEVTLLAIDSSVDLLSLSPGLPTAEAFAEFATISVFIDIQGQFFEVLGFLYGLADMPRLVRVDSVTLTPTVGADGTVTVDASLNATIFTTAIPVTVVAEEPAPEPEEGAEAPPEEGEPGE